MNPNPETAKWLEPIVSTCFFVTWIVLGLGSLVLFRLKRDAAFKRRWFPWSVGLAGVLFIVFSSTQMVLSSRSLGSLGMLLFVIPFVGLIAWLNIRNTKFCDECGATTYDTSRLLKPAEFCSRCGADLRSDLSFHDVSR